MTTDLDTTLREFRPADLAAVRELLLETVHVSYAGIYPPSAIRHFAQHHEAEQIVADAAGGFAVVVERDGQIVGTGTLTGEGKVARVYVRPDVQGRGLGRQIMARLEEQARAAGMGRVFLFASIPARRFYEALGYRLVEAKTATMEDGEKLDYFEMDKDLTDGRGAGDGTSA